MSVRYDATRKRWITDYYDQTGKRHAPTFATKRAAQDHVGEVRKPIRTGTYCDPRTTPTLATVAREWLTNKQDRRPATVAQWETHLERHILPALGHARLDRVDVATVETFRNTLRSGSATREPLKPQTVNKILTTLAAVFAFANKRKAVVGNPARDADRLHLDGQEVTPGSEAAQADALRVDPDEILTPAEAVRLVDHAPSLFASAVLMTATMTGLRSGELFALTWDDVELETEPPTLRVRRGLTHARTRREREAAEAPRRAAARFYAPKTKDSRRSVRLAPALVSVLRRWKLACPTSRLGLVFPGPTGEPAHRTYVRGCVLRPALRAAALRHVTMHSLRHTFASALIMYGAPVTEVASLLGHSSPAVTLKLYAHWFDGIQTDAVDRIGELFGGGAAAVAADSSKLAAEKPVKRRKGAVTS